MLKNRRLTTALIIVIMITFASCDCLQNVRGTVLDAETSQPIQGVLMQKENQPYSQAETDGEGDFEISSISGGLFRCPPMTVVVSKDGYETQVVKIDNAGHETIKLKRIVH